MDEVRNEAVKDSGDRTVFSSGAVRDMHPSDKGRCDLIPWESLMFAIDDPAMRRFTDFLNTQDYMALREAIYMYAGETFGSFPNAMLELSKHFEQGAEKYGVDNWRKGIPARSYVDSSIRHYWKHRRGDADERHDRACLWNWVCLLWTLEYKPEMCEDLWENA